MEKPHKKDIIEKLIKRSWLLSILLIGIFSLFLYFASYRIAIIIAKYTVTNFEFWEKFLHELSIGLIIAVILAIILERIVHDLILERIGNTLEPFTFIPNVLMGSKEMGIEDIFGRRYYDSKIRAEKQIFHSIKNQINKKNGEIKILCVAAPDLFNLGSAISRLIVKEFTNKTNQCKLKILFLDKNSEWAKFRADLEDPHPTLNHIDELLIYLKDLKKDPILSSKVEYRLYDAPPVVFLIITDDFVIYEPYPIIKVDRVTAPIGGWIPMIMAKSDSETYARWENHFDYLWIISDSVWQNRRYF